MIVDVLLSLIPVFSLIALGSVLRRLKLLSPEGWGALERLTYFVLFPPLMFMSIVEGRFAGNEALLLSMTLAAAVATMGTLMLLGRPLLARDGAQFSSVFQAGIRWNGYVTLGVLTGLYGDEGVALSAVGFATLVPMNNVMSVLVLTRYAGSEPAPFRRVITSILTNPLIISTVLAIVLVSAGVRVSKPIGDTLNLLGDATVSLGLICVGAALDLSSMRSAKWPLAAGTVLRLVVMPGVTAGFAYLIGLSGMVFEVAVICASAPVATSAYILSRQLGGDSKLMANLITLTTTISLLTIPATILLTRMLH